MEEKYKVISIGKHKDPYQVPLNLIQLATYLEYYGSNSKRDLEYIFGLFDLDLPSRKRAVNTVDFKTDVKERRSLQVINKALTMELLAGGMFGYVDHPVEVHSNCLVSRPQPDGAVDEERYQVVPNNFAQGGLSDVQIDYANYMVILEVSAKYQPSEEHFRNQLSSTLKHARIVREEGYDKPMYCLLITERSLKLVGNRFALKEIHANIKSSERIYIAAMSTEELAALGHTMATTYGNEITKVHSDDLLNVLKATAEKGVNGRFHELFVEHLKAERSRLHGLWI